MQPVTSFLMQCLLIVSLCRLGFSQGTSMDQGVRLQKANEVATLTCPVTSSANSTIWFRNGSEVQERDGKKYSIDSVNQTLTIFKVGEHDVGFYECQVANRNYTLTISIAPVVLPLGKSRNLVEGDRLTLDCQFWAWPAANVSWYRTDPSSADTLVNATLVTNGSRLTIDSVARTDYMKYVCVASNDISTNNATILVRVKRKLAALWPFLGIVAEIVILIIIIIVYEKRRSKQQADEARKEEAEQLTNSTEHRSKDDVRQRK